MNLNNKKIGIWGLGVVGTSALRFLSTKTNTLTVLDKKAPTPELETLISGTHAHYMSEQQLDQFLENNEFIIASPGIDLSTYAAYKDKWICELDLFCSEWKKPIIAITGTVGKTSIVHLATQLFTQAGVKVATGGNIGTGMLDLLPLQETVDICILELSSFQLEFARNFNPSIALWTNFYPNHLDRHKTLDAYFEAKAHLIQNQSPEHHALIPWALREKIQNISHRPWIFFGTDIPLKERLTFRNHESLVTIEDDNIVWITQNTKDILTSVNSLPSLSYQANWITLAALCKLGHIPLITSPNNSYNLPPHRLRLVNTVNGVSFYNDSKSTIAEATLAAVTEFKGKPVHLFLGGLSKGVDRSDLILQLKDKVKTIYCFGAEAATLHIICTKIGIEAYQDPDLKLSFDRCVAHALSGDIVLLSPAGASYDLFKDYLERGTYFEKLVNEYASR